MDKIVIGIDGKTGAGKSVTVKGLVRHYRDIVYIESHDFYLPITYSYVSMEQQGFSVDEIIEYFDKFLRVNYKIFHKKVYFDFFVPTSELGISRFDLRTKTYEVTSNPKIAKIISRLFTRTVDEIRENYNVIVIGRKVTNSYNKFDYHFTFEADDALRIKRIVERDNVSYSAATLHDKGDTNEKFRDTITIDTTSLSKSEVIKQVDNILSTKNSRKKKVKVLFIGAPCTGKSTICQVCARKYKEPYIKEAMREYCEQNDLAPNEVTEELFIKANKAQISNVNKQLKVAKKFLFCDSGAIVAINVWRSEEIFELVDKQINNADIIFLCDLDVPFVADGRRNSDFNITLTAQEEIKKYLKEKNIKHIILHGSVDERLNTVEEILNNYFRR